MSAFQTALKMDADAIEVDVQQTSDGKIIIIHDDTLDRTTNGTGKVAEKSYKELQSLDAGSWFNPKYFGERIPLLRDFFELIHKKVHAIIEVKYGSSVYPDIEKNVIALIQSYKLIDSVIVSSSRITVLQTFYSLLPALKLGKVLTPKEHWRSLFLLNPISTKQDLTAIIKEIHPHWSFIDAEFMEWARLAGMTVCPWTINTIIKAKAVAERGVQGVITNYPDIVLRTVRKS
jgi:glycerophosphoryl diester phosphodiesterase